MGPIWARGVSVSTRFLRRSECVAHRVQRRFQPFGEGCALQGWEKDADAHALAVAPERELACAAGRLLQLHAHPVGVEGRLDRIAVRRASHDPEDLAREEDVLLVLRGALARTKR